MGWACRVLPHLGSLPVTLLCLQISQVLGNEIKFAVREPLGLRWALLTGVWGGRGVRPASGLALDSNPSHSPCRPPKTDSPWAPWLEREGPPEVWGLAARDPAVTFPLLPPQGLAVRFSCALLRHRGPGKPPPCPAPPPGTAGLPLLGAPLPPWVLLPLPAGMAVMLRPHWSGLAGCLLVLAPDARPTCALAHPGLPWPWF